MPYVLDLLLAKIDVVGVRETGDRLGGERRKFVVLDSGLDPRARVGLEVRPMPELEPSRMGGLLRLRRVACLFN